MMVETELTRKKELLLALIKCNYQPGQRFSASTIQCLLHSQNNVFLAIENVGRTLHYLSKQGPLEEHLVIMGSVHHGAPRYKWLYSVWEEDR